MSTQPRFPDIEVYVKRVETADIITWLCDTFTNVEVVRTEPSTLCKIQPEASKATSGPKHMNCTITQKVAKGGYASIWFESNQTPWDSDRDCALAVFERFKSETRCSTGGWEGEDDEDDGRWIRFSDKGEQIVNWHQS